jgi:hypothetical protein
MDGEIAGLLLNDQRHGSSRGDLLREPIQQLIRQAHVTGSEQQNDQPQPWQATRDGQQKGMVGCRCHSHHHPTTHQFKLPRGTMFMTDASASICLLPGHHDHPGCD